MTKFKIGDVLTINEYYKTEYKRIFGKEPKDRGGKVLEIYEDTGYQPIYFFTEADKEGNKDGLAEEFLELK